jgi:hypothetical protein
VLARHFQWLREFAVGHRGRADIQGDRLKEVGGSALAASGARADAVLQESGARGRSGGFQALLVASWSGWRS